MLVFLFYSGLPAPQFIEKAAGKKPHETTHN